MTPWGFKPALLVAAGCAAAAGFAAGLAPEVPALDKDAASYLAARARLVEEERARRPSAALPLSPEEEAADRRLAELRRREVERVGPYLPPAHSFLLEKTRRLIEDSPLLGVMRRLPKGGILHVHGSAGGDLHWLVAHATYRPDCYVFQSAEGTVVRGTLRISPRPPGSDWQRIVDLRAAAPDPRAFDEELFRSITLGPEDREAPDIWQEFRNCFRRGWDLFDDQAIRAGHWRQMVDGFIDENVQYVEFRGWPVDEAVFREARTRDPEFAVKFIPAAGRGKDRAFVEGALERALAERERDPGRVSGFDLVEEEDETHATLYFADLILAARRKAEARGFSLPLFLHSGETSRAQSENLYDAVLLGARRIGHGLALVRHPLLMELVRERGIAVEVCPISNQVLGYVSDLRAHPAVAYLNAGIPVVLAPDDPGIMRHTVSHDFYEAFLAWELDLRGLKHLARSSLVHSAMAADEKERALLAWEKRWAVFVQWLNEAGDALPASR